MGKKIRQQWGLLLLTVITLFAYGGLVRLHWLSGTLREGHVWETIVWFLIAFAAFLGAVFWAEKYGLMMHWVWTAAVLYRVLLLFTTPTLSDDVYRYIWDGYVVANGVSPYAYAIDAPELDYLDNPQRSQANNAWMASPYLPAAQLVFGGITAVFPLHPTFMQAGMIVFDLAVAWFISRLLAMAGLPPGRLLLYLWNPLVIVEVAHGAHLDAWMIFLALTAVYLTFNRLPDENDEKHRKSIWPPFFLALATLTKILPVLLFPVLFWQWQWRQRISYVVFTVGLLLPFGWQAGWGLSGDLDGTGLFGALRIYGRQWNFNSGPFHWLELYLRQYNETNPADAAKIIFLALFGLLITIVWLLARSRSTPQSIMCLMSIPLMAYILMTPTLHPWYLLFLLAFLPFLSPSKAEPPGNWLLTAPWIYLSGALIFSYLTYQDPNGFGELEWVRNLEWLPTLALLFAAILVQIRWQRPRPFINGR